MICTSKYPYITCLALFILTGCPSSSKVKPDPKPIEQPIKVEKDNEADQAAQKAAQQQKDATTKADASAKNTTEQATGVTKRVQAVKDAQVQLKAQLDKNPMLLLNDKKNRGSKDLVITAVGDVSQPTKQWPGPTNQLKGKVFAPTKHLIDSADLAFMNLENPVSDKTPKAKKEFSFTSAPERLGWYMDAGFNLYSLSNNHIADANQEGIDDTIMHLKEKSKARKMTVYFAGAGKSRKEAEAPTYVKLPNKEMTIAFFSTGFSRSPNVSKFWSTSLIPQIKEARKKADIVIVSVHAGKEYKHIPQKNLVSLYRKWVDAGAHLVIGHHPHVIRPVEVYKDAFIIHSLGNYVFASRTRRYREHKAKMYGLMARIVIRDAKVRGLEMTPLWVNNSADWVLDGKRMKNANFTPQLITGKFADAFFEDFNNWTKESALTPLKRVKDTGVYVIPFKETKTTKPKDTKTVSEKPQS